MKLKKWMRFFFECETKLFFFMLVIFIAGIIWGSVSLKINNVQATETDILSIIDMSGFKNLFFKNYLLIIVSFLLGFSAIGVPFICFVLLFDGICLGIFLERIVLCYGFKGLSIATASLFVVVLIKFISIAVISFSSIRLSLTLFNVFHDNTRYVSPKYYAKPHVVKFIFFSLVNVINAFICVFSFKLLAVVFI